MKTEISNSKKIQIQQNINNMLFSWHEGTIFVIKDVQFEEEVVTSKGGWLSKPKTKTKFIITNAEVHKWVRSGNFVGVLTDESAHEFLAYANIYTLRRYWRDLKEQIEAFGITVVTNNEYNNHTKEEELKAYRAVHGEPSTEVKQS